MNSETVLDHIIFQLTPTRTRCEVFVVVGDVTERLTAGLLKPFVSHLQAAEEQLATGGYSIKLEPLDCRNSYWFTKGTTERFVRFVSTPQVLERVYTIEMELVQLEETIRMQRLTAARVENPNLIDSPTISILGNEVTTSDDKPRPLEKIREEVSDRSDFGVGKSGSSKKQLLRALDARRLVLQKEQGMAFARAAAAGFDLGHLLQLIMFSECFGAARLRDACINYVALCNKRQVTGFGSGEVKLKGEQFLWAFSSPACNKILMSLKGGDAATMMVDGPPCLHDEVRLHTHLEHSDTVKGIQKNLPSVQVNSSPASYQWSNITSSPGWPMIHQPNSANTFVGYQYGFSPVSLQSFNAVSGFSPSDVMGRFRPFMGAYDQLPLKTRPDIHVLSSQEMPHLRKVQVGNGSMQHLGRSDGQGPKHQDSTQHMCDMASSEATDSSVEMSNSLEGPSLVQQKLKLHGEREKDIIRSKRNKTCYKSSDSGDSSSATSAADSVIATRQNMEMASLEQSFVSYRCRDDNSERINCESDRFVAANLQVSKRVVTSDQSLVLFEQEREESLACRMKKRLDFEAAEVPIKQERRMRENADDSFVAYSSSREHEQRTKSIMELDLKSHQIYDMMSKKALKVNSMASPWQDPDDLLMLPRQRQRPSTATSSHVMRADIELSKNREPNLQKASMAPPERSQERVRRFLDQYNEKREAKLRGVAGSSKSADREGKLKAMQEVLEKRKLEMGRSRRPEKTNLQVEAQLRADKVRAYKAGLQKSKKDKEDEERKRLEELKAKRQERIAARSGNPSSSSRTAAHTKTSSSSVRQKMSSQPMLSSSSRLSPVQRGRPSQLNSAQRATKTAERKPVGSQPTLPRSASKPLLRSAAPSALELWGQAGRSEGLQTRRGSSSLPKSNSLKAPLRTCSPSGKNSKVIFGVAGKREGDGRVSSSSSKNGNKQGVISQVHPSNEKGLSLKRNIEAPPPTARKEILRSSEERRPEARTFLKKGSGPGSLGKIAQRPRSGSPAKLSIVESRCPLLAGSTLVEGVRGSTSSLPNDGPGAFEVVGLGLLEVVGCTDYSKADEEMHGADARAHADMQESTLNYSHEVAIPLSGGHEPVKASRVSSSPLSSQVPSVDSRKGPPLDLAMSRLTLFDKFCRVNGKSTEGSDKLAATIEATPNVMSQESLLEDSSISSYSRVTTLRGKEQVKGLKSLLNFGRRSSQVPVDSEVDGIGSAGLEGVSGNYAVNGVFKGNTEANGSEKQPKNGSRHSPGKPLKAVASDSSALKGPTARVSRPFSFLGSLRSKASDPKRQ